MFYIFECLLTQNPKILITLTKALNSPYSSRSYGRTGASIESFLAEIDFKTSFTVKFPKKGGARNRGNWFYNEGDGKFWEILYIPSWQRTADPSVYEDPLCVANYLFFKFWLTLPPPPQLACHFQPPLPLSFLLSCFFGWMGDHVTWYNGSTHIEPLVP